MGCETCKLRGNSPKAGMRLAILFMFPLLLSACATVTRGTHDKLTVRSEPAGADVALSSGERGVTPTMFRKKRTEGFNVTVSKPGFRSVTVPVESKFSATGGAAVLGNALVGGVIGGAVDMATGATRSLYPNPVVVNLVRSGKSSRTRQRDAAPQPAPTTTPNQQTRAAPSSARPSPAPRVR
jgi:hypothetical protein